MNIEPVFVPKKTTEEKLQSIDVSIESCLKIAKQELKKRLEMTPAEYGHIRLLTAIKELEEVEYWFEKVKNVPL